MSTEADLSPDRFVAVMVAAVPQTAPLVDEHFTDHGELLLHLLASDLLRLAIAEFHGGEPEVSRRLLEVVARGLEEGDEAVSDALAVSFIENAGYGRGEPPEFLALWPAALRDELQRQQDWWGATGAQDLELIAELVASPKFQDRARGGLLAVPSVGQPWADELLQRLLVHDEDTWVTAMVGEALLEAASVPAMRVVLASVHEADQRVDAAADDTMRADAESTADELNALLDPGIDLFLDGGLWGRLRPVVAELLDDPDAAMRREAAELWERHGEQVP